MMVGQNIIVFLLYLVELSTSESVYNETLVQDDLEKSYSNINCFPDDLPAKLLNIPLNEANPSNFCPPKTDNGVPQNPFKYPFAFAQRGLFDGGWTRQVTVRELPIATSMSGVQMRLQRGAIREMHWHLSGEWGIVLYGEVRITLVEPNGLAFVDDVQAGDIWFFPAGSPHSIQGIGKDGGFFLLIFNQGDFNEFATFLLTEFMAHVPLSVLAKNFGVPKSTFNNLPTNLPLYIFRGQLPQPLDVERQYVTRGTGSVPQSISFHGNRMRPNVTRTGGSIKVIDARNFPVTGIAAAIVTLRPGAIRELHWHPNADEWQFYISGKGRMTVYPGGDDDSRTMDFQTGDVGFIPQQYPHYIENTCDEDLVFLETFPTAYYQDVSLALWLAHTPPVIVNSHIRTGEGFITSINKTEAFIQPW